MNSVKILHTADLHLGAKFADLSDEKAKLRQSELRQSFLGLVSSHIDADIVLMAGDIFDAGDVSLAEAEFLVSVFEKYPDKKFLMVCGNHDPYFSPIWEYMSSILPENAVLFTPDGDEVVFDELKTRVWGISFQNEICTSPLIEGKTMPGGDYINLMLVHGDLYTEGSTYNPISVGDISLSSADYVALGHIHKFNTIERISSVTYAYSGTCEGHGYDECGRLGCIYGTVSKKMADVNFECTSLRTYNKINIDISDAKTIEAVKELVECKITPDNMYHITLTGELNEEVILNDFVILAGLNAFDIRLDYNVKEPYNLDEISNEANIKGYFVKTAQKELSLATCEEDKKIINQALRCVLDAFENGGKVTERE